LRADDLTAVHFMIDAAVADRLRKRWEYFGIETPLRIIDCPDRRITRAAQDLVSKARAEYRNTNVTVLLPRRSYAPLLGRLLHDRTADKISRAISRIPDAAATIVPYDVQSRIREAFPDLFEERVTRELEKVQSRMAQRDQERLDEYEHPDAPPSVIAVDGLLPGHLATVEGRVSEVEDSDETGQHVIVIGDDSGDLRIKFSKGRGADVQPGQVLRVTGKAGQTGNRPIYMADPTYRIIDTPEQNWA